MNTYPTLSIILATYNSESTIKACLKSICNQNYPNDKIEILIADGSSQDATLTIVKNFQSIIHIKIFTILENLQEAEYNKGIAVSKAQNEILVFIDHDNVLPHKNWLSKMVFPLVSDQGISGVEVLRFAYRKSDLLLDRYFALIGGVDPVPYYLGKDARLSYSESTYTLFGKSEDKGNYFKVEFNKDNVPTLGANGAMLRRKLIQFAKADPSNFFHIDINVDLIKKGYNKYAFVKDEIIHYKSTRIRDFLKFLWRRKYIIEKQYFENLDKRRYAVYMPRKDKRKLFWFVIYSITFIKPLYDSLRGYSKKADIAWFAHPFVCLGFLIVYTLAVFKLKINKR